MLKVMIVDDENLFLEYMRTAIQWENQGFTICSEARNGKDALDKINDCEPEIILADINMPFMDGLSFAERLAEIYPEISIVFITGHSEFEYARKAVKLGVTDYLLKPFNRAELTATLSKLKLSIEKRKQEQAESKVNETMLKTQLLQQLIHEDCSYDESLSRRLLESGLVSSDSTLFVVAAIEIDNKNSNARDMNLWRYAVSNAAAEIMSAYGRHILFHDAEGRMVSLLQMTEAEGAQFKIEGYSRLCQFVKQYLKFTITVGIGCIVNDFASIGKSYLESSIGLRNKVVAGAGQVIEYQKLEYDGNSGSYSFEMNEKLLLGLRFGDLDEVRLTLNNVYSEIREQKLNLEYTLGMMSGLIVLCLSYLAEARHDLEEVYGPGFNPFVAMREQQSYQAACDWVTEIYVKAIQYGFDNRSTRGRQIIESALQYIDNNYSDNTLSVEGIAQNVFIDASYLRKVFKKEIGTTVSECITNVRMNNAKKLVVDGGYKLTAISEMVGYSDAGYFSKCFKKHFGMTPREFENLQC